MMRVGRNSNSDNDGSSDESVKISAHLKPQHDDIALMADTEKDDEELRRVDNKFNHSEPVDDDHASFVDWAHGVLDPPVEPIAAAAVSNAPPASWLQDSGPTFMEEEDFTDPADVDDDGALLRSNQSNNKNNNRNNNPDTIVVSSQFRPSGPTFIDEEEIEDDGYEFKDDIENDDYDFGAKLTTETFQIPSGGRISVTTTNEEENGPTHEKISNTSDSNRTNNTTPNMEEEDEKSKYKRPYDGGKNSTHRSRNRDRRRRELGSKSMSEATTNKEGARGGSFALSVASSSSSKPGAERIDGREAPTHNDATDDATRNTIVYGAVENASGSMNSLSSLVNRSTGDDTTGDPPDIATNTTTTTTTTTDNINTNSKTRFSSAALSTATCESVVTNTNGSTHPTTTLIEAQLVTSERSMNDAMVVCGTAEVIDTELIQEQKQKQKRQRAIQIVLGLIVVIIALCLAGLYIEPKNKKDALSNSGPSPPPPGGCDGICQGTSSTHFGCEADVPEHYALGCHPTGSCYYRATAQENYPYAGFCTYQVNDAFKSLPPPHDDDDDDAPPRVYDYACYRNTTAVVAQQLLDFIASNYTTTQDHYRLCPGQTSTIGHWQDFGEHPYELSRYDFHLTVLTANTTIACGESNNNTDDVNAETTILEETTTNASSIASCIINDGSPFQVLLQPYTDEIQKQSFQDVLATSPAGAMVAATMSNEDWDDVLAALYTQVLSNVTFRGLTFTGDIRNNNNKLGKSVIINQAGDILMDRCRWHNIDAPSGLVFLTNDRLDQNPALPINSTQLTLQHCRFDNLRYDHPIIANVNETVYVVNTTFANLRVEALEGYGNTCSGNIEEDDFDEVYTHDGNMTTVENITDTCACVLACAGTAYCGITDRSCLGDDVSITRPDFIMASSNATVYIDPASSQCGFNSSRRP